MFDIVLRAYPESNPRQNSDNPLMNAPVIVNQLNGEQLAFYNENGYLAVDRVATDHEVAEIRALYDRMFSSRTGRNAGDHFDLAGTDEDGKEPLLAQILQPSKYFPELKQTALYRNVGTLIRDLSGPEAEVTGDHAINKSPRHGAETPWHQDEAYWAALSRTIRHHPGRSSRPLSDHSTGPTSTSIAFASTRRTMPCHVLTGSAATMHGKSSWQTCTFVSIVVLYLNRF